MDKKTEKEFAKWLENQNEEKDLKKKKKEKNKKLFIGFMIFILIFGFISAIFEEGGYEAVDYGVSACECYSVVMLQSNQMVIETDIGYARIDDVRSWCLNEYSNKRMLECN
tara:strand:+ start:197 stop:529 length:333 start_codon:yes stop_codon:yes gene_type:complete